MALHYCKKCGRVVHKKPLKINDPSSMDKNCDYCSSEVYPVPEKYWLDGHDIMITNEQKQLLREELVKTSPEFDEYLFNHRDADLRAKCARVEAATAHGKAILEGRDRGNRFGIECPYCHATNVRKVSLAGRAVSAGIFGLGSKKIGKQWHCDRCGSDF